MAYRVDATGMELNKTLRQLGGKYAQYSYSKVSWDDANRGTVGGGLSCWGSNITDTYLKGKAGESFGTVRSSNWNEKLGVTSANGIALMSDSHDPSQPLKPTTLASFLKTIGTHGAYAGLDAKLQLLDKAIDNKVSVRFQTVFLPASTSRGAAHATQQFATEAYNYNTNSDQNPKNLLLLCTTQGTAVQQDGLGAKKLFTHTYNASDKTVTRHWLEAEATRHKVGGAQKETAEERADALKRNKATAAVIGTRACGTRFNVLMTVQIPLKQKRWTAPTKGFGGMTKCCNMASVAACGGGGNGVVNECYVYDVDKEEECDVGGLFDTASTSMFGSALPRARCARRGGGGAKVGAARAARVSKGDVYDTTWKGVAVKAPQRHTHEHITCTIVLYNTVEGGVPSAADVKAAVDDMETLYAQCSATGRLADQEFDFMKADLTVADVQKTKHKVGHKIDAGAVLQTPATVNYTVFPDGVSEINTPTGPPTKKKKKQIIEIDPPVQIDGSVEDVDEDYAVYIADGAPVGAAANNQTAQAT
ncbi:hypothetical protein OAM67_00605 [bacterium]|nr:hypothetical protein [bacterium]